MNVKGFIVFLHVLLKTTTFLTSRLTHVGLMVNHGEGHFAPPPKKVTFICISLTKFYLYNISIFAPTANMRWFTSPLPPLPPLPFSPLPAPNFIPTSCLLFPIIALQKALSVGSLLFWQDLTKGCISHGLRWLEWKKGKTKRG